MCANIGRSLCGPKGQGQWNMTYGIVVLKAHSMQDIPVLSGHLCYTDLTSDEHTSEQLHITMESLISSPRQLNIFLLLNSMF